MRESLLQESTEIYDTLVGFAEQAEQAGIPGCDDAFLLPRTLVPTANAGVSQASNAAGVSRDDHRAPADYITLPDAMPMPTDTIAAPELDDFGGLPGISFTVQTPAADEVQGTAQYPPRPYDAEQSASGTVDGAYAPAQASLAVRLTRYPMIGRSARGGHARPRTQPGRPVRRRWCAGPPAANHIGTHD